MIHVATVHFEDDRWINTQLDFLDRNIEKDYQVYAFLDKIDDKHDEKFYYVNRQPIPPHWLKMNILMDVIVMHSRNDDDVVICIDGDAFPIASLDDFIEENLKRYPLLAVQRLENNGDCQPHPCFCVTTVGFWKEIQGDWAKGYAWENPQGKLVSDTGGALLGSLLEKGIEWLPLLRSNKVNVHPLMFALYGDLVYHHGAGFRDCVFRCDNPFVHKQHEINLFHKLIDLLPDAGGGHRLKRTLHPLYRELEFVKLKNKKQSQEVYEEIVQNIQFYEMFQE